MKYLIEIGEEYKWVREELQTYFEKAMSEVSSRERGEYAAGYLKAVQELSDALESRYHAIRRGHTDEDEEPEKKEPRGRYA